MGPQSVVNHNVLHCLNVLKIQWCVPLIFHINVAISLGESVDSFFIGTLKLLDIIYDFHVEGQSVVGFLFLNIFFLYPHLSMLIKSEKTVNKSHSHNIVTSQQSTKKIAKIL